MSWATSLGPARGIAEAVDAPGDAHVLLVRPSWARIGRDPAGERPHRGRRRTPRRAGPEGDGRERPVHARAPALDVGLDAEAARREEHPDVSHRGWLYGAIETRHVGVDGRAGLGFGLRRLVGSAEHAERSRLPVGAGLAAAARAASQ